MKSGFPVLRDIKILSKNHLGITKSYGIDAGWVNALASRVAGYLSSQQCAIGPFVSVLLYLDTSSPSRLHSVDKIDHNVIAVSYSLPSLLEFNQIETHNQLVHIIFDVLRYLAARSETETAILDTIEKQVVLCREELEIPFLSKELKDISLELFYKIKEPYPYFAQLYFRIVAKPEPNCRFMMEAYVIELKQLISAVTISKKGMLTFKPSTSEGAKRTIQKFLNRGYRFPIHYDSGTLLQEHELS